MAAGAVAASQSLKGASAQVVISGEISQLCRLEGWVYTSSCLMHSCQSTHLPACKGDAPSGKQTCRTQLQFQPLGILNTWWLEFHRFSVLFVSLRLRTMDEMNDES